MRKDLWHSSPTDTHAWAAEEEERLMDNLMEKCIDGRSTEAEERVMTQMMITSPSVGKRYAQALVDIHQQHELTANLQKKQKVEEDLPCPRILTSKASFPQRCPMMAVFDPYKAKWKWKYAPKAESKAPSTLTPSTRTTANGNMSESQSKKKARTQ